MNKKRDNAVENDKSDPVQPKPLGQVLKEQIESGLESHQRSNLGIFLSAGGAGLEIGFSLLLMSVLYTMYEGSMAPSDLHVLMAACYPLGFLLVIIGRSELFTEQTALAVIPVLSGKADIQSLLRLWGLVYAGNIIGGLLFSYLFFYLGPAMELTSLDAFTAIAYKLVRLDWQYILLGGVLAGWLMGLLGWLITSAKETFSRIFIIFLITFVIGIGTLHHCVIGHIEVFTGLLASDEITLMHYLKFQLHATIGNIIGGVFFVSLLKYSHITTTA